MAARQLDAARSPRKSSAAKAPRRPGRPSGSVSTPEQRNRLLDTALKLFAQHGIAETALSTIAREAGVTPAMMHYYFKSRDQLLDAVIDERIQPRRVALSQAFEADADDPVRVITRLAEQLLKTAAESPWFPALWMREVISDNGTLRARVHQRHGMVQLQSAVERMARWQAQGKINPHIEPSLLFVSMFGLVVLPLIASKSWSKDPTGKKPTPGDIARHAVALLTHGVSPPRQHRRRST